MAFIGGCMTSAPYLLARAPTDERNERLMLLSLDVIRDPQGSSVLELAGVWTLVYFCATSRPAVVTSAVEAGIMEVAVSALHKSSPSEW